MKHERDGKGCGLIRSRCRRGGSGGSEKESDDASQGTAQRVQDTITGQVLRRMDRHKRATNYPNLSGAGQCEFATMVTR